MYANAFLFVRTIVRAALRPRPLQRIWQWIDEHVIIPIETGSPNHGPLKTTRFPIMRGLYDLAQNPRVHFFLLCKSARVGGTLFCLTLVMHKIATRAGAILWLDPTRRTALKFSRSELNPFLLACAATRSLAIFSKTTWTSLEKQFRACWLRLVGSGSAAELGGFQAEMVVRNERDKLRVEIARESTAADLAEARTKQFRETRLILDNSTPTIDSADTWQEFLRGSQHYCYFPCPHCSLDRSRSSQQSDQSSQSESGRELGETAGSAAASDLSPATKDCIAGNRELHAGDPVLQDGEWPVGWSEQSRTRVFAGWQRLTFFPEQREVPFDLDLNPLPPGQTREEKTGRVKFEQFAKWEERPIAGEPDKTERVKVGYDLEAVEQGATYQCAHCSRDIEHASLNDMLAGYRWVALNPKAPVDRISAHLSALLSPWETWGQLAKKFLMARGSVKRLHDFYNSDLGLPFVRYATNIKDSDLDLVVKRCPRPYVLRTIPFEPICLTMAVDVQGMCYWWSIRAHGILWDHPEQPSWSALIDYGQCVAWDQIEELAGIKPMPGGKLNQYFFRGADGKLASHTVSAGLVDSGFDAQEGKNVYEFCERNAAIFSPSKGGGGHQLQQSHVRASPVHNGKLELLWYLDDYFKQQLYYHCIKEGKDQFWWLPTNLESDYRAQLTAERTVEQHGRLKWIVEGEQGNHLGDTEKMHEVLRTTVIEEILDQHRAARAAAEEAEAAKPGTEK